MATATQNDLTDSALISSLRKAASTWFRNYDLLLLEELIRRYEQAKKEKA
jgi:hypothetical protein